MRYSGIRGWWGRRRRGRVGRACVEPTTIKADSTPHMGVRHSQIYGRTFLRLLCLDSLARSLHAFARRVDDLQFSVWPSSGMPGAEDEGKVAGGYELACLITLCDTCTCLACIYLRRKCPKV